MFSKLFVLDKTIFLSEMVTSHKEESFFILMYIKEQIPLIKK